MLNKVLGSTDLWKTVRVAIRSKHGTARLAVLLIMLFGGIVLIRAAVALVVHVAGPAAGGVVGTIVDGTL